MNLKAKRAAIKEKIDSLYALLSDPSPSRQEDPELQAVYEHWLQELVELAAPSTCFIVLYDDGIDGVTENAWERKEDPTGRLALASTGPAWPTLPEFAGYSVFATKKEAMARAEHYRTCYNTLVEEWPIEEVREAVAAKRSLLRPKAWARCVEYAKVAWRIDDALMLFDVSGKEAEEFLNRNAKNIQERMTERGWEAMESCGAMDNLKKVEPE